MNKAIAILFCIATFAIILMFAMASAEESADAGDLVSVNPAVFCSGAAASLSVASAGC